MTLVGSLTGSWLVDMLIGAFIYYGITQAIADWRKF